MSSRNFCIFNHELLLFYTDALILIILDKTLRGERLLRRTLISLGERSTVVSPKAFVSVTGRLIIVVISQYFANSQVKHDIGMHAMASTLLYILVSQLKNCLNPPPPPRTHNAVIVHEINLILFDNFDLWYVAVLITTDYG